MGNSIHLTTDFTTVENQLIDDQDIDTDKSIEFTVSEQEVTQLKNSLPNFDVIIDALHEHVGIEFSVESDH